MSLSKKELAEIEKLSFEESVQQLEAIVKDMEQGSGKLDTSIAAYAKGNALLDHCNKKLEEAKLEVQKIVSVDGDDVKTEPFDVD